MENFKNIHFLSMLIASFFFTLFLMDILSMTNFSLKSRYLFLSITFVIFSFYALGSFLKKKNTEKSMIFILKIFILLSFLYILCFVFRHFGQIGISRTEYLFFALALSIQAIDGLIFRSYKNNFNLKNRSDHSSN